MSNSLDNGLEISIEIIQQDHVRVIGVYFGGLATPSETNQTFDASALTQADAYTRTDILDFDRIRETPHNRG